MHHLLFACHHQNGILIKITKIKIPIPNTNESLLIQYDSVNKRFLFLFDKYLYFIDLNMSFKKYVDNFYI